MLYIVFETNPLVSILFTFTNNLSSTSAFKLAKSNFTASLDVSIPVAFFKSAFAVLFDNQL